MSHSFSLAMGLSMDSLLTALVLRGTRPTCTRRVTRDPVRLSDLGFWRVSIWVSLWNQIYFSSIKRKGLGSDRQGKLILILLLCLSILETEHFLPSWDSLHPEQRRERREVRNMSRVLLCGFVLLFVCCLFSVLRVDFTV